MVYLYINDVVIPAPSALGVRYHSFAVRFLKRSKFSMFRNKIPSFPFLTVMNSRLGEITRFTQTQQKRIFTNTNYVTCGKTQPRCFKY